MKFAEIEKLSDLLDYAIKDHEASGLKFDYSNWLRKDCGRLAGGVMYETLGMRCPTYAEQLAPSTDVVPDITIRGRLAALSSLVFGRIQEALSNMATDMPGPFASPRAWEPIENLGQAKEALAILRERGL